MIGGQQEGKRGVVVVAGALRRLMACKTSGRSAVGTINNNLKCLKFLRKS
jgi:hypothetical protein